MSLFDGFDSGPLAQNYALVQQARNQRRQIRTQRQQGEREAALEMARLQAAQRKQQADALENSIKAIDTALSQPNLSAEAAAEYIRQKSILSREHGEILGVESFGSAFTPQGETFRVPAPGRFGAPLIDVTPDPISLMARRLTTPGPKTQAEIAEIQARTGHLGAQTSGLLQEQGYRTEDRPLDIEAKRVGIQEKKAGIGEAEARKGKILQETRFADQLQPSLLERSLLENLGLGLRNEATQVTNQYLPLSLQSEIARNEGAAAQSFTSANVLDRLAPAREEEIRSRAESAKASAAESRARTAEVKANAEAERALKSADTALKRASAVALDAKNKNRDQIMELEIKRAVADLDQVLQNTSIPAELRAQIEAAQGQISALRGAEGIGGLPGTIIAKLEGVASQLEALRARIPIHAAGKRAGLTYTETEDFLNVFNSRLRGQAPMAQDAMLQQIIQRSQQRGSGIKPAGIMELFKAWRQVVEGR